MTPPKVGLCAGSCAQQSRMSPTYASSPGKSPQGSDAAGGTSGRCLPSVTRATTCHGPESCHGTCQVMSSHRMMPNE